MTEALRRRFVLIAMLALTVTLALLAASINLTYANRNRRHADFLLDTLYEQGSIPGRRQDRDELTEESPFETRYFIVTISADGSELSADLDHIAAFDRDGAAGYVAQILSEGRSRGYLGRYRYAVHRNGDGSQTVLVLDCYQEQLAAGAVLRITLAAGGTCWCAVLLLLVLFSRAAVRPFAENLQKQKRFVTDASHELKTPLTIISANADVLALTGGENEWLQSIRSQTQRLDALVQSMVELSRTEEAPENACFSEFDLSTAAEEAIAPFRTVAEAQGLTLTAALPPNVRVRGEPDALRRLLSILLENALKYTLPGGCIRVTLTRRGHGAALAVSNPCAPLPPEALAHLFDRFYRADASRSRATGGCGIGLSVAQAIARRHRAKLTVAQEHGEIVFRLVL